MCKITNGKKLVLYLVVLSAVNGSEFIALFLSGITETCTFFLIFMLKFFLKKFRTFMGLVQARGPYV